MENSGFFEKVYKIVETIPVGKVATYGQIARLCGSPRAARQVGWALHVNPRPFVVPCHRVVNKSGRIAPSFAFGGEDVQRNLLLQEGVTFTDENTVDLKKTSLGEMICWTKKCLPCWQCFRNRWVTVTKL